MMAETKIYRALAEAFLAEGVDTLFVLTGDGNMHWEAALAERNSFQSYHVRHEHSACAMATAYAAKTGKVGVASVTCGPGLTQIMTALATAARARIPLVVFAGTAATAAGPHSGGATGQHIKRLTFKGSDTLNWTVHAHGAIAFAFGIAAVAVWVLLERRQANPRARRAMSWLCLLIAAQGVVGAVQYETHLPSELVWVHVAMASVTWLCVLWAIAAIGPPDPRRARKRAQIRASIVQPNP